MSRLIRRGAGQHSRSRFARGTREVRRAVGAVSAVEMLEGRLLLAGILSSDIRIPGERDFYSFEFTEPKKIYFDALTNQANLRWSLEGPAGVVVTDRPFTQSDSVDIANPVINVAAGTYSLSVDGVGDFTGPYQFRLLDLAADAAPITPGQPVNTSLIPANGTDVYTLTANAGDRFTFDNAAAAPSLGNARWRLIDRYNNVVFQNSLTQDAVNVTLAAGGTYTLLVEGRIMDTAANGFYGFNVHFLGNTPPVPFTGTALTLGTTINGTIGAGGEVDPYVFTLAGDSRLAFDALGDFPNLQWSLTGPAGVAVNGRNFQSSDSFDLSNPVIDLVAGTYRLDVSGTSGSVTGPYSFRLLDFASATALTPGTPASGNLNPATETDIYQFNVSAPNSKYFFDATTGISNATWRLINPAGSVVFSSGFTSNVDTLTLPFAGTYYVVIEGRRNSGAASAPYSFNVQPITVVNAAMTLNTATSGNIAVPGESDTFSFSLASPAKLAFDTRTDSSAFNWTLTGPGGVVFVSGRTFQGSDSFDFGTPFMNLPAGNYTLTVDATGNNTGVYSFALLDYATATAFTPGTPVSGTLDPATETDIYKFDVTTPNSRYFFDVTTAVSNATWRLVDPYDNVLFTTNLATDVDTLTLSQPGTYFLVLEGRRNSGTAPVAYAFNVQPVTTASAPLTPGTTVNGNIAVPGEGDQYTFNLASPSKVAFDVLGDFPSFTWTLTGPGGAVIVNGRPLQGSDSFDQGTPFLNLAAGAYTLTIDANGDNTGAYAFRLLNYGAATPLTPGTAVTGTLNPATETDIHSFDVTSPNSRYYFDVTTGISNGSWRLVDPFDNILFTTNFNTDVDTLTLTQPGKYFLVLEGRRNAGAVSAPYAFNVHPITVGTTPLALGTTVNGNISVPGESDAYTFNLPGAAKLAFDVLGDFPGFNWSLTGPGGAVIVSNRALQGSDSFDQPTPFLNLPAGAYTLTVDANTDTTGAYSFRLLDYAAATALTPGTPVSSALNPATETDLYRFNVASPNSRFYFDAIPGVSNASWRLVDSFDNVLFTHGFTTDVDTLTLAEPGTYFVVVEGRRNAGTAPADYTFNVQPVTPGNVPLVVGGVTSGNIAVAGESDAFSFNLASPATVLFDSLTDSGNFQWNLTGPGGAVVVPNRSFQGSDSFDGFSLLRLPSGNYTLTVDGTADNTGAYQFRLLDLASAAAITPGTAVSETLDPGNSTRLYKFTVANAGDRFLFDGGSPGFNGSWRLIDPFANQLFSGTPSLQTDQGPLALDAPGDYTLLIEGRRNATAPQSLSFNVVPQGNTPPNPLTGDPITLGTTVSGTIAAAGEIDNYRFTLAAPATLYFDSLVNNGNARWDLRGPSGVVVSARAFNSSDSVDITNPQLALPAGEYMLSVSSSSGAAGAYSFRVLDLATAAPVTPGTAFSGTLNPAQETDAYRFTGNAGERVFFDVQERTGAGNARWRLIDPLGNFVFNNEFFGTVTADIEPLTLPVTGSYTLLLEGRFIDTGTATYTVNVQPVTDSTTPLTLGAIVNGNISPTGEADNYTFTLASPATLYFDSLTNNNRLRWNLTGPGGALVSNRAFNSSDSVDITNPQLVLPAGSYTLNVDGVGDETAAYSFRLSDLAAATPITPNTPFSGTLNPANETDAFRFNATAGDRFYFDVQERTGAGNARWRLIDPAGNFVFNNEFFGSVGTDIDALAVPLTGTYTLLLEGRFSDTGTATYTVNVQPAADSTTPLAIGATVSSNIAAAGEQDHYTFTLASPATLYFDSLTLNNPNLRWSLVGPGGTLVNNRGFNNSDSVDITDPRLVLPAGSYTLTVDATADNVPGYSFRLLDLSSGTALTPGTPFTGAIDPARETDVIKFNANAGDKFFFNVTERTGAGNARWRLFDPAGNFVFNNEFFGSVGTDIDTLTVPLTGAYTLLIEGRFNDTSTGTYTFNVTPVTHSSTPLAINAVTAGEIAVTGEQDNYTFTLPAAGTFYFDSLTNSNNLRWSLVGPGGTLVNNRGFNNSDSVDITDPRLVLPAGNYTLTVDAIGDVLSPYSFRLIDFAAATPITKGVSFSNTLNPANETDAYSFTANAGDKIFFDVKARTGADNARWRLIDPLGNPVFNNEFFGSVNTDVDVRVMPHTGTYTLLIEGRFLDTTPGAYTVNVQPVIDGILPVVAGGFFNVDLGPIHRVQFAFSQNVGASLGTGDFVLTNLNTNTPVTITGVTYDGQNNVASVSVGQTLAEGNYRMRLVAAGINDAQNRKLDGNADGVEGDDYFFDFFFMLGDANQDRAVNFNDLISVAQNYNKSPRLFSQGDFNYDGTVGFADLVALAQRYNTTLPPVAAPVPAPVPAALPAASPAPVAAAKPTGNFSNSRIKPDQLQSPPAKKAPAPKARTARANTR